MQDRFSSGLAALDETKQAGEDTVQVATLDSLSLDPPNIMKVDVEGKEGKVFLGGANLIEKHKPMIIFENVRSFSDVAGAMEPVFFLSDRGYVFYRLAWSKKVEGHNCYIGDEFEEHAQPAELLTLAEFEPAERFLLADGGNIFACHREKTGELEKHFQRL